MQTGHKLVGSTFTLYALDSSPSVPLLIETRPETSTTSLIVSARPDFGLLAARFSQGPEAPATSALAKAVLSCSRCRGARTPSCSVCWRNIWRILSSTPTLWQTLLALCPVCPGSYPNCQLVGCKDKGGSRKDHPQIPLSS